MSYITYDKMPSMRPIAIPTANKGFIGAIILWLISSRKWEIAEDWQFKLNTHEYVIPAGFVFDGASIPKFFWSYLSPTGVLLMPGLIHDWVYKYTKLNRVDGNKSLTMNQKDCDILFRDLAIAINGFTVINWAAYYILRAFGWVAWNSHRKND